MNALSARRDCKSAHSWHQPPRTPTLNRRSYQTAKMTQPGWLPAGVNLLGPRVEACLERGEKTFSLGVTGAHSSL